MEKLRSAIAGPYPVITVVGEGGVGKSALTLKLCYEIVDDATKPFDAVIWTTAKASRLTPHEIQEIDGAITSSIGVIEAAASVIG
jgi:GTPase SAR1 family protein